MRGDFNSDFFRGNRKKIRELFKGTAPIVLTSNVLLQRSVDEFFPFRQDASFYYFTGLEIPGSVLVLEKDKEYLILPERPKLADHDEGPLDLEFVTNRSGIVEILEHKEGWKKLGGRIRRIKHIATIPKPPKYIPVLGFYTNPARDLLQRKIKSYNSEIDVIDLSKLIAGLRSQKQPIEIEAIRSAISLTMRALKEVKKKLPRLKNESEIEAIIESCFLNHQAKKAFDTVVASGKNATIIHYRKNNQPLGSGDLVVVDVGSEVERYASDITRTYAISAPNKRQTQVYNAVLETQQFAFSLLKPGVLLKEYEEKVEHFIGEQLRELGLIKTIDKQSVRRYFPHLTSHFLGLETHDIGNYDKPLKAGMTLAVEPGIYIAEEGIGVRIEDDVLITEDGVENLSISLPAS